MPGLCRRRAGIGLAERFGACAFAMLLLFGLTAHPARATQSQGPTWALPSPSPTATFGLRAGFYGFTRLEHNHFNYAVPRGATIHDAVEIFSLSNKTLTVRLYPADLLVARGGGLAPAQEAAPRKDAGAWLRVSRNSVELKPRQVIRVPFTVRVPATATPGVHLAAVVGSTLLGRAGGGLTVETRVALQAVVTVQGTIHLGLSVGEPKLGGDGHTATLTVHNDGNVLLTLTGNIHLDGNTAPLGPRDLYVIPGGDATLTAHLTRVPWLGRYRLSAEVRAALDGHQVGTYASSATLWLLPWAYLAATPIVVVAGAATWYLTRTRRSAWRSRRREERALLANFRATRADRQLRP